jgi:hypothetical protein
MFRALVLDQQGNILLDAVKAVNDGDTLKFFPLMATVNLFMHVFNKEESEIVEFSGDRGVVAIKPVLLNGSTEYVYLYLDSIDTSKVERERILCLLEKSLLLLRFTYADLKSKSYEGHQMNAFMKVLRDLILQEHLSEDALFGAVESLPVSNDLMLVVRDLCRQSYDSVYNSALSGSLLKPYIMLFVGSKLLCKVNSASNGITLDNDELLIIKHVQHQCYVDLHHGHSNCFLYRQVLNEQEDIWLLAVLADNSTLSMDLIGEFQKLKLSQFTSFLSTLKETRLPMTSYLSSFPGLVYFVYLDHQRQCCLIPDMESIFLSPLGLDSEGSDSKRTTMKNSVKNALLSLLALCNGSSERKNRLLIRQEHFTMVYERQFKASQFTRETFKKRSSSFSGELGQNDNQTIANASNELWSLWLSIIPPKSLLTQNKSLLSLLNE